MNTNEILRKKHISFSAINSLLKMSLVLKYYFTLITDNDGGSSMFFWAEINSGWFEMYREYRWFTLGVK